MRVRVSVGRVLVVALILVCTAPLGACTKPPPALTKAELDAAKMPEKHPKVEPMPEKGCRSCHKEQPPIKQP